VKFLVPWPVLVWMGDRMNVWSRADVPPPRPNGAFFVDAFAQPFTQARFVTSQPPAPVAGSSLDTVMTVVIAVWMAGVTLLMVRWAVRWIQLRRVVRTATPAGSGRELDIFRRVQRTDPRFAHVALALTERPIGPGVAGSVWPVVLWPRGISERLTDEEMTSVFAHELCHVRRRDNVISALVRVAETLFWFHPAVWLLGRRLQDEREQACDEGVVAATSPHVYAEALVKTCQFHLDAPLACGAGGTPATFSSRIARILRSGERRPVSPWVRRGIAALVTGGLALPVVVTAVMPPEIVGLGPNRLLQSPQLLVAWAPRGLSPVAHGDERFVTAAVWPSTSSTPGGLQAFAGGRVAGTGVSPAELIRTAFGSTKALRLYEVVGLPDWAYRERFDLRARAASDFVNEPSGEPRQFVTMLQHLLADEFALVVHRERRTIPVYALVRFGSTLGPRLRPSALNCWRPGEGPVPAIPVHPRQWCHSQFLRKGITEAASMEWLAGIVGLRQRLDRPVLDRTGLAGPYDIQWLPPLPEQPVTPTLEAQLGLTLEERTESVDLLVVDRIEHLKEGRR
jgi:uncharacterized protein (TIGR03435 family)